MNYETKSIVARSLNNRIANGERIRANDPLWTRPLSAVGVADPPVPGSTMDRSLFYAVDVYGWQCSAESFSDSRGEPIDLEAEAANPQPRKVLCS